MGYWEDEYDRNGWREYVNKVLSYRFGDSMRDYEVTEEDKRQLDHLMGVLDDNSLDESFEYHTPRSDVSFEYNTPGPQKKKKRASSIVNSSFFPEFGPKELEVDDIADHISENLCKRLADLSPITSQCTRPAQDDPDIVKSLTFDMPEDETMDHFEGGGDGAIQNTLSVSSVIEIEISDPVHTENNVEERKQSHNPPPEDIDFDMEEPEEFEELEIQPDDIGSNLEWTMLLDHFEIDGLDGETFTAEDDGPTQRRQSDEEFDFPFDSSPAKEKPPRRRLRIPEDTPKSPVNMFDGASPSQDDNVKRRLKRLIVPASSSGSDISSIDDINFQLQDTQPYSTIESTIPLNLARVNTARTPLTLEEHQKYAVDWMQARELPNASHFRGGILADEMGLGKTICCLALVAAKASEMSNPKKRRPTLIITPLSLVHQWEQEIKDKTTLSVGLYHGVNRKRFQRSPEFYAFDVILTTYDTIRVKESTYCRPPESDLTSASSPSSRWVQPKRRRDSKPLASKLHKVYWERVILDEAHLISNSVTARAQAACQLTGRARWCVTGTPIQNRLEDVHTLFQFLGLPAIENDSHLQALLDECMLRRMKSSLPCQLPVKAEHMLKISFQTRAERDWYANVRETTREQVEQHMQERRPARHIFELLLRLRQVCDSPRLLPVSTAPLPTVQMSTKMQVLFDHLQRVKQEGNQMLVISQWTSFLDMLVEQLAITNPSIRCGRIDGRMSASSRHQVVQKFQTTNEVDVLMMSLRCGALGLNLTKARYVFLMEPCWNPSLEAQAIDRTHRIGQEHTVHIYRFLMQNTIEEKIYELQQQKRDLAATVLTRKKSSRRATNDWVALMA
ncbi:Aste57867_1350 [Aphanomyces stellatus]|uniref:Aste57867_1350 protein n=1 Tax=Aphanomyces stellatus TaxID=120398 RepID=A0A485K623_9STRA|nr:hypothetical protein As57867_001349 [Aphanomyces stellatus]VFT78569.1 Aste57867_1350 [Aphanomyces stellatus]